MVSETEHKLIRRDGSSGDVQFVLTQPEIEIGRDPAVDIVVESSGVSRQHARLTREGTRYFLEDLGSSNGTFINGQRLGQRQPLHSGDEIGFGRSVLFIYQAPSSSLAATALELEAPEELDATTLERDFTFVESDATRAPVPPARQQATQQPSAQLVVTVDDSSTTTYPMKKSVIRIGRAEDNDIVILARIISRYHARLELTGKGYQLVPLPEASNPVFLNEQPLLEPYHLQHGDELQIGLTGESTVKLVYHAPESLKFSPLSRERSPLEQYPAAEPRITDGTSRTGDPEAARDPAQTMLAEQFEMSFDEDGIELSVAIAGQKPAHYRLEDYTIKIGRAEDNDIVIPSKIVSRYHARLERTPRGYQVVPLPEAANPILHEGRPLTEPRHLAHGDILRIGSQDPGLMVTLTYTNRAESVVHSQVQRTIDFRDGTLVTIGRDPDNDVTIDQPIVSRFHAQIERVGQRYRLRDLRSANGTFVNDKAVEGEVWLKPEDTIRIGSYRFVLDENQLAQFDESGGLKVEVVNVNKWVRKDLNILQNISLFFKPREFIVVVGQSGGGKSTLLDAISGYRPATHGHVRVNDIDVYENFDAIRHDIGYVPQRDIIHLELTTYQALSYAAQLRMPRDTTRQERHQRIMEVLEDLDLVHRKDTQISSLSGGQQKRVSIGVELLTKPGLFFLDEPTSGLDPGTETQFMQLMRRLADQGRTIILVTHATKNVMLADKVVFLARGGYLAWFGPPEEALEYFDQYRSERDRRARDIEFDEIYAILDDTSLGSPEQWAKRFHEHQAYQKHIVQPLEEHNLTPIQSQPKSKDKEQGTKGKRSTARRQVSALRQFFILSARNVKILTRDRFSLALMLLVAPIVSLLDVILAFALGNNPFDFNGGFMPDVLITLFLPTVYGVMVAGLSQMREIVKEQDIYRRERLVNLKLLPYILSKVWVAALLALYQAAAYLVVHYIAFDMPGGTLEIGLFYVSLLLATMAGMMLGLFASVLAPNANAAPLIVIILMLPQIVLGGALVPVPEAVSAPISTRWAFQAFMAISGVGTDVAADACWALPKESREALPQDYRNANCRCMGINALNPNSCNFPGLGQFSNASISLPAPAAPADELPTPPPEPRERPPEPEVPPQPVKPADEADQVAMADYLRDLEAWQEEVDQIQAGYQAELAAYEGEVTLYEAQIEAYQADLEVYRQRRIDHQTALGEWQAEQARAIVPAERAIEQFHQDFGWLFVDKNNEPVYWNTLTNTWVSQGIIIAVLFVLIIVLQKRKDII